METTPEQQENLAQLEQTWAEQDALEATIQRAYAPPKRAAGGAPKRNPLAELPKLGRDSPAEAVTAIIDRLTDRRTGLRGGEAMFAILHEIATNARYDRDKIKAAETILAYRYGRPMQSIAHVDVTPQWLEREIRARYPGLDDAAVQQLITKLAERGALPSPE